MRFAKSSLTTIALTTIALAAITGHRAKAADTDLGPAIQGMRDEIRELRRDLRALRELLEKERVCSAITKESPISPRADDGADQGRVVYFFFAKWCGPCQNMMPIIDRLRDEGYRIVKVDIDAGQELVKRFNVMHIPALVARAGDESVNLHGVQSEETLREKLRLFKDSGALPKDILSQAVLRGDSPVLDRPVTIDVAGALPDLNGVHIESYLESNIALRAQASVSKMTGNEIIASIDGRPVFASEIFQRAFTQGLTPEGTSLLVATQALAAGQISEQYFRELQVVAIRKFAKDYIRTRALSQAMIASLAKTQKEKTEDAIAKEFNNYLERLKKDFNVTTVFEVDKRLRKQGTSLLSLKDEFRDRLLADEYLRGHAMRVAEHPLKRPKSQAGVPFLERRVTVDCDDRPLSEVLDQIVGDRRRIEFRYEQPFGGFHYSTVQQMDGGPGPESLAAAFSQRVTLHVADVPVSVALERVFDQLHVRYEIQEGHLRLDFPADEQRREALKRRVTIDCDNLPLRKFIEHITRDWQLAKVVLVPTTVDVQAPVTMHVSDATLESVLKQGFDQAHVRFEFRDKCLALSPAAEPTEEDRRIGELIEKRQGEQEGELIAEIVVEGNSAISTPAILQKLKVTAGRQASVKAIQDDVQSLWKTGWFSTVETKFRQPLKGPGQVLVFVVFERPAVPSVQDTGNKDNVTKKLEPLVLVAYPVADLLATPPPSLPPQKIDFQPLESLIQAAADAKSWKASGGAGQIEHADNTLSLVIRQSPEVHKQIANLLQKLREPRQLRVTIRGAVLDHRVYELLKGGSIKLPSDTWADFSCLTRAQSDFLLNTSDGTLVLERLPAASVAVGKEVTIPTQQGKKVWPQAVRLRTGQLAGRPYLWLDFVGDNPVSATPLQTTVQMQLLPDLRPVLIEMKSPPPAREWQSPWGLSHTVDQLVGKAQERMYLLISPEIEVGETPKEGPAARQ